MLGCSVVKVFVRVLVRRLGKLPDDNMGKVSSRRYSDQVGAGGVCEEEEEQFISSVIESSN